MRHRRKFKSNEASPVRKHALVLRKSSGCPQDQPAVAQQEIEHKSIGIDSDTILNVGLSTMAQLKPQEPFEQWRAAGGRRGAKEAPCVDVKRDPIAIPRVRQAGG